MSTTNFYSVIPVKASNLTASQTNSMTTFSVPTETQSSIVQLTDILTTLTTFTNLPTLTIIPNSMYPAENASYQPQIQQINTTYCGLSCIFVSNDTICAMGVCTHIIYPEVEPTYYECGLCDLDTSFCFQGSCYHRGNIGDVCVEDDQCQSYYCKHGNFSSPYSFCESVPSDSYGIVLPAVYTIIAIGGLIAALILICRCQHGIPNNRNNNTRRYERRQRFEPLAMEMRSAQPFSLEIENADTLPPYNEATPPKYEEIEREITYSFNGQGEQIITANPTETDFGHLNVE